VQVRGCPDPADVMDVVVDEREHPAVPAQDGVRDGALGRFPRGSGEKAGSSAQLLDAGKDLVRLGRARPGHRHRPVVLGTTPASGEHDELLAPAKSVAKRRRISAR